jgi:flagellar motor switch protein FliN/FliY
VSEETTMSETTQHAGDAAAATDVVLEEIAGPPARGLGSGDLGLVLDVPVELVVEIGRTRMTIRETLAIGRGTIVSLDKLAGEPADLLVNGKLIARGEVVAIDEEFGLRVTEVVPPERRLDAGRS